MRLFDEFADAGDGVFSADLLVQPDALISLAMVIEPAEASFGGAKPLMDCGHESPALRSSAIR